MDLIKGAGKSSRMSLISKPSCQILSKALAMSEKKYTRGLVLGEATMNQLRYSEQLMNCRALGSKTALLRNNKISSSAVLIQALQSTNSYTLLKQESNEIGR
ncbi:hypothetical protein TNCV_5001851 [Trichonephila clavipes]|nr:hypothetical protein TNCV_5001851 [Trichonephila clavipes]